MGRKSAVMAKHEAEKAEEVKKAEGDSIEEESS